MKRLQSLAAAALLICSLISCGNVRTEEPGTVPDETQNAPYTEYRTIPISGMDGKYKSSDRTIEDGAGLLMLSSADSFEFRAECKGKVSVNISCVTTGTSGDTDVYFTGYVDGERCAERYGFQEDGEYELTLADSLAEGEHSFRVVRQTEWDHGDIRVTGVSLDGRLLDAPEDRGLFIEFIGDSTTTGFGNVSDQYEGGEWGGEPVYQDATQAYPFLIGEELDADISVVAVQGVGCACGFQPFTMGEIYGAYPRSGEEDYTYAEKRSADLVIIALLSNDSENRKKAGLLPKQIAEKARELVVEVRKTHPAAKIVFMPAAYFNLVEKFMNDLGGADAGYYTVLMPTELHGHGGHPLTGGHSEAAKILAEYISGLFQ